MKPSRALFSLLTLETERKFACTLQTIPLLNKNAGSPPIRNLFFEGQKTFKDIYYDFPNPSPPATSLSSLGIWIRQRNGDWQAKVRQGGDYTNTQSAELKGESDIHAHLLTLPIPFPPPNSTPGLLGLGLHKTACFSTTRHSWRADEKGIFKIVVDETDFGHIVGEVEVELLVEQEEVDVVEFSRGVNEWIERFMEREVERVVCDDEEGEPPGGVEQMTWEEKFEQQVENMEQQFEEKMKWEWETMEQWETREQEEEKEWEWENMERKGESGKGKQ